MATSSNKGDHFRVSEQNAVPFDSNTGWKDGMWMVVMVRPLGLANDDDKSLKEGGVHNIGFAVHDDNIAARGHQISFVRTIGFGAKANIQAVKLPQSRRPGYARRRSSIASRWPNPAELSMKYRRSGTTSYQRTRSIASASAAGARASPRMTGNFSP